MINKERLLSTFLDYVRIDSESTHEGAMAARLTADLKALGCECYMDDSREKTGSEVGNLYFTLPGNAPGEPILFSSHMDTVTPGVGVVPVVEDGVIRSSGNTVLGGDDKSGIASVVEAIRTIVELDLPHPTIQVVFTVCEEQGLRGSIAMEYDKVQTKRAIVLDSGGAPGLIVVSAPGKYKVKATVIGRRAHAGVAPETGISAVQVAARGIAEMKLLRVDEETTANISIVSCNYATNIVPERLELVGEARSRSDEKLEAQVRHMVQCLQDACDQAGASLEVDLSKDYAAYAFDEKDDFVRHAMAACERIGLTPTLAGSGGGSDANVFNGNGIKALNLATGMSKVHTTDEIITVEDLNKTCALVLTLATL